MMDDRSSIIDHPSSIIHHRSSNPSPMPTPQSDVEQLAQLASAVAALRHQVARRIVGQTDTVDGVLTAILAGGHALLVGVPGLAKTLLVSTVAEALALSFNRVQFTP